MPNRLATDSDFAKPLQKELKIGVAGCTGRVGQLLCKELLSGTNDKLSLAGGTVRKSKLPDDDDIGTALGHGVLDIPVFSDPKKLFYIADVVIDFTTPEATARHIRLAAKSHTPIIIGTTGLSDEQEQEMRDAALECPVIYASNTSVGVNLLVSLVEKTASLLQDGWDIEINETHHKYKVDAPSGTALALGRAAARARNQDLEEQAVYAREGHTGQRENNTIGFSVQRGGDVVGEHTVTFYGHGERIELTHRATDRTLFARGALRAAKWIAAQNPGLYSMTDVLGLS